MMLFTFSPFKLMTCGNFRKSYCAERKKVSQLRATSVKLERKLDLIRAVVAA
jgi:hypothetical protein